MKKFGSLIIEGSHHELVSLLAALKDRRSKEFVYISDLSERYARNIFLKPDEAACFRALGPNSFDATIWVVIQSCRLRVANIVPETVTSLSISQYNVLLSSFFNHFVAPELKSENVVYIDGENIDLAEVLPDDCYKKLISWAKTCNQDSPISHPLDEQKWFAFLESMSNEPVERRLSAEDLITWLQEDCGWKASLLPERFENLTQAYEYGLALLDYLNDNE